MTVRRAILDDLPAITEIYNDAVLNTIATFDTQPKSLDEQKAWFSEHGMKYPLMVAEIDGAVTGWASLSRWSGRCAYANTAEISVYVSRIHRRKGIGRQLIREIVAEGQRVGLHTLIARIAGGNEVSIRLHESAGFKHIGILREVGEKFGKLIDVHMMQKIYP
ncbi:MAG: N-acetyltransferase [candidate division WOR-3 bacterium]|nr:MAG: N-acetyltransferase [candidate division WOR-3 bacterium]